MGRVERKQIVNIRCEKYFCKVHILSTCGNSFNMIIMTQKKLYMVVVSETMIDFFLLKCM